MTSIEISHFGGQVTLSEGAELDKVLAERHGDDANEFMVTPVSNSFPMLTILVRGNHSAIYFFPRDRHAGFVSIGDEAPGRVFTFFSGSPTEEIQIASECIVPFDVARHAAHESVESRSPSSCVRWLEL